MEKPEVKRIVRQLGADMVGIASAQLLNEYPPDPQWPQTPGRLWEECRSVIVIAKRMPWGVYRSRDRVERLGVPHLVFAELDRIALELSYRLEDQGHYGVPFLKEAVDVELGNGLLRKANYGPLSLRHVAVEAGLGTLGLNMMLLTREYGPRVYLTCVLTDAELESDERIHEQLCLGPACGRCLRACPSDAVWHWGLDTDRCSQNAQVLGLPKLLHFLGKIIAREEWENMRKTNAVGAFAGCLRCVEVCPVGDDYVSHLKDRQATIPESTPEKKARLREMQAIERNGLETRGRAISERWIGQHPADGR